MALMPLGTLSHALTNEEAARWIEQAVGALRHGGLLCIELAHPGELFDGTLLEVTLFSICQYACMLLHMRDNI